MTSPRHPPVARWIAGRVEAIGPVVALAGSAAAGQRRAGRAWNLLFYALWHRHHIERAPLPPDTAAALAGNA